MLLYELSDSPFVYLGVGPIWEGTAFATRSFSGVLSGDIMKIKKKEFIRRAAKMTSLETLLPGVAHEISNIDNFILLNIALLAEAWKDTRPILDEYYEENGELYIGGMGYTEIRDNISDLYAGMADGSRRVERIVKALRAFAGPERLDTTQSLHINEVVESAFVLCDGFIKKSTRQFEVEYGSGLPECKGSFQQIEQVVIHLIECTCKALKSQDETVRLSTSYDSVAHAVLVEIESRGLDASHEMLSQIGDKSPGDEWYWAGASSELPVCAQIVREHGGALTIIEEEKRGVVFTISLPA